LRRFAVFAGLIAVAGAAEAAAAAIDLSKPHGNKSGCLNKDGQQVYAEDMLLLTRTELVTAVSACAITDKVANKDGSLTLKTECEMEGEEGRTPATFTVAPGKKNPKRLTISDETGFVISEVALCQ